MSQNLKILAGLALAFAIGALCRFANIPVPAPPALVGALLVVAMTCGFLLADRFAARRATQVANCGGPTGGTMKGDAA